MVLDIGELEDRPSDAIPGFADRLERLLPGLREHRCSPGYEGGFIERLERGTWAAHVVEHVALELQTMAGSEVGFGKTRETSRRGVYHVAYRYRDEETGLQAGRDAVDVVEAAVARKAIDVGGLVARLRSMLESNRLGPSTASIVEEARRRGIPVTRLDGGSFIQLGHGARQRRIQATMTDRTGGIGVEIADDKERTKRLLRDAGIPVPEGERVRSAEEALAVAQRIGWPVAVKPLVGNHGRGITTDVRDAEQLRAAFASAASIHPRAIVERHLQGADFRVLVIDHKMVAAARRDPAQVVGDGVSSVRQLIDATNADPRRGDGHGNVLTRIEADDALRQMLARQGLALDAVPPEGALVVLKPTANISSGGTATDVTDEVHPAVRAACERMSRIVGLDIMGIDIVAPNLRRPLKETGGGVVEVNAAPGFRMHLAPASGKPRNVAAPVVDMLFPDGSDGRIPIVAITGTNGKTTTVRLLAHILRFNGARVGLTTTGGVEIANQLVLEGDYSGPGGARAVLTDPTVDHAVLEVARGGILRRGLAFDECDVGVLLNVGSDHLGEGEIETVDDLARVKATVVEAVRDDGTAVLNAEDPRVAPLRERLRCACIMFAVDPTTRALRQHVEDGGVGITVQQGWVTILKGASQFPLVLVRDIPITLEGHAAFNVQNALAAVAAAHALGVPDDVICSSLTTFNPTVGQLPGRLNLLDLGRFRVLIDYGHNVPALRALAEVLPHLSRGGRIINVGGGSGNRRDEDLRAFGRTIAKMYHHIVLADPDPRGREPGATPDVIRDGLREAGFPDQNLQIVLDEKEAIDVALSMARDDDLVVIQADDVGAAIRKVRSLQTGVFAPPVAPPPPAPPLVEREAGQVAERARR